MSTKSMLTLVKKKAERGLWLEEAPVPETGPNDVLIKIRKTAICGTDVHIYNWDAWAQKTIPFPMTIGHEFVGEVVGFGENVRHLRMGERVSGEGHIVCGRCRNCRAGKRHLCNATRGVGVNRSGVFAQYLSLPAENVWPCSEHICEDTASFYDALGNAVHTALAFDLAGEDVLITGAGPIGSMAAAVCRHVGARHVVVTDVNPFRLDLAAKMGATRIVDVKNERLSEVMAGLGMKEGFDVGLEMSGCAQAFGEMVQAMCHGGKIAVLGIQTPNTLIDWDKVVFGCLTLKGVYGREMFETWYKMTTMLESGLDVSKIITHKLDFRDYEKGFEAMNSGMSGKVVLDWTRA